MPFTYNGFDFDNGVTTRLKPEARYLQRAPAQHVMTALGARPGGVLALRPPGPRTDNLTGLLIGDVASGAIETVRDAMLKALETPRGRLIASVAGTRYTVATPQNVSVEIASPGNGIYSVDFVSEDAYDSAVSPSGDTRTPVLALLPADSPTYGLGVALTPGGSAQAPLRVLLTNQAGGITPALWQLSNTTTRRAIATSASVPAGSALLVDSQAGLWAGSLSAVAGLWPLYDAAGNPLDFSSNSRDLTANGAITYLADGPQNGAGTGFPGVSAAFLNSANAAFAITGDLSVCCWVKFTALAGTVVPLSKAGANTGYSLMVNTTTVNFSRGTGAAVVTATLTQPLSTGAWCFLAGTYSAANQRQRLYLATETLLPQLQAQAAATLATSNAANDLRIGSGHYTDGTAYPLNGAVSQAAVYTTELSATQLTNIWKRGPQAVSDSAQSLFGQFPTLDPGAGATNTLQLAAIHPTTAATPRMATLWRSRWA